MAPNKSMTDAVTELKPAHSEAEQALTQQLQLAAEDITTLCPPPAVWQRIETSLGQQQAPAKKKTALWLVAASVFAVTVSAGWLALTNYQLQQQLQTVLTINQSLEMQLVADNIPGYRQAKLMRKIQAVELELLEANSLEQKLDVLKRRQQLITELLNKQQGQRNEFEI